jgi:hypothetical protein
MPKIIVFIKKTSEVMHNIATIILPSHSTQNVDLPQAIIKNTEITVLNLEVFFVENSSY